MGRFFAFLEIFHSADWSAKGAPCVCFYFNSLNLTLDEVLDPVGLVRGRRRDQHVRDVRRRARELEVRSVARMGTTADASGLPTALHQRVRLGQRVFQLLFLLFFKVKVIDANYILSEL